LIVRILIPTGAASRRAAFIKHSRSKSDIAQVNVAVAFNMDGGIARDVRIALGAVAPTAMRARGTEALLEGERPTPELLSRVQAQVSAEVRPISDWRASADYRRRISGVIARRALERALATAPGRTAE
jgi:carbon-monoxide dehydrogenase medium subunit